MKELSIEEKAKRYDGAIKKVNNYYEGKTKLYSNVDKTLDCLFPELKDSDDERIRKEIIAIFKGEISYTSEENAQKYIAWLEKQGDTNETINRDEFAQGVLRGAAIKLITWIDYNTAKGNMCLSNMECKVIEDALVNGDWDKIYAYIKRKLEKQDKSKFEQCIQEGDKIVSNEDGTHFNVSQLERVSQKVTDTKEAAKKFLKTAGIMDKNGELADEYRLKKQGANSVSTTKGNTSVTNAEVVSYSTATTTIEPKFKVGDWVVYNRDDCSKEIIQVYDIRDGRYYFTDNVHFSWSIKECDEKCHLWTIKDANPGDVLCDGQLIILFKQWEDGTDYNFVIAHAGIDVSGKLQITDGHWLINNNSHPATKEQRDILFQKMKEAGYEWDAEKKELKKIHVIDEGKAEMDYCFTKMMSGEKINPVWSEDDEIEFNHILKTLTSVAKEQEIKGYNNLTSSINWLKTLKDRVQPQWKPSDKQIQALEYQVNSTYIGSWQYKASKELLEQLKKL